MTHVTEEDMVMHYYGEAGDLVQTSTHLAECEACRRRFDELSRALQALSAIDVPERDAGYGAEVWARIQPKLDVPGPGSWSERAAAVFTWPRLVTAGVLAVLLAAAFVAGRSTAPPHVASEPRRAEAPSEAARERVRLAAVGDHLERSRVVLAEISHRNGGGPADISQEQSVAADLVATSRLYRQAAVRNGDPAVASLLEDLERMLVEIANSPSPASHDDLARWREQIDTKGLLFKVSVLGARVRQRQQDAITASRPGTKTST